MRWSVGVLGWKRLDVGVFVREGGYVVVVVPSGRNCLL